MSVSFFFLFFSFFFFFFGYKHTTRPRTPPHPFSCWYLQWSQRRHFAKLRRNRCELIVVQGPITYTFHNNKQQSKSQTMSVQIHTFFQSKLRWNPFPQVALTTLWAVSAGPIETGPLQVDYYTIPCQSSHQSQNSVSPNFQTKFLPHKHKTQPTIHTFFQSKLRWNPFPQVALTALWAVSAGPLETGPLQVDCYAIPCQSSHQSQNNVSPNFQTKFLPHKQKTQPTASKKNRVSRAHNPPDTRAHVQLTKPSLCCNSTYSVFNPVNRPISVASFVKSDLSKDLFFFKKNNNIENIVKEKIVNPKYQNKNKQTKKTKKERKKYYCK